MHIEVSLGQGTEFRVRSVGIYRDKDVSTCGAMGRVSNSSVVVPFPYSVVLAKVCDILGRRPPYNRFIMMTERSIHVMLLQYLIVKASAYVHTDVSEGPEEHFRGCARDLKRRLSLFHGTRVR